ncbi:glutathione S-transferase family protein [Sphingomonas abaci]|uniref:Glutathione S-transferase n=1 Tax=Sphingomonas abaci TaxID=237611 RepID=A0A7W7AFW2_9SPHN|nr:glutathione S-transferase family protein [Sphingomonas abaci]MBB4616288.1 glutathione S-transferase [Sphingomonas abaci]
MAGMRLYDNGWAPSPRRVRLYLAEKGHGLSEAIERVPVDLQHGGNLAAAYLAVNPRGLVPALVLADGRVIDDSIAICRYVEALHPDPPLFGSDPFAIAMVETWLRRIEAEGYAAAVYALRNGHPAFAGRALPGVLAGEGAAPPQLPALVERAGVLWAGFVASLDAHLAEREWIADRHYSMADIAALVAVDFAHRARLAVPESCGHLRRWHAAATARPSSGA